MPILNDPRTYVTFWTPENRLRLTFALSKAITTQLTLDRLT